MANITIDIEDNQADLDAVKAQVASASDALTAAITSGQEALAALAAFQITFTASVPAQ